MKHLWQLLLCSILFIACNNDSKKNKSTDFISESASIVFSVNNIEGFTSNLSNNSFLNSFKNTNTYNQYKTLNVLKNIKTKHPIYIGIENDSTFTFSFSTKYTDSLIKTDSVNIKNISFNKIDFTQLSLDKSILYTTKIDSIIIGSNNKTLLYNLATSKSKAKHFQNSIAIQDKSAAFSVIINENSTIKTPFFNQKLTLNSFTNYISLDADVSQDQIILNGITKGTDSTKSLINVFKNTNAQSNAIANIAPSNSNGFLSITYKNYLTFNKNLNTFNHTKDTLVNPLLKHSIEFGEVYFNDSNLFIINSEDIIATKEALLNQQNIAEDYRNVTIYNYNNPNIFNDSLSPFIINVTANNYCILDQFVVFGNSTEALENVIANYQNQTTFSSREYYKNVVSKVSTDASILQALTPESLSHTFQQNLNSAKDFNFKDYKTSVLQFIYDRDFAHVNAVINKAKQNYRDQTISEVFNISLENEILNNPQFVTNHQSKQKEIIAQDINNKLYLISNNGKIIWTKQIDEAILGRVNQIDMYKNGRLQLAFATKNHVYILDRNGKDVDNFPLKFKDEITQPLAVFDYDKRKKYRLFVTQNNSVLVYDIKGKPVKGFDFNKTKSPILTTPKHIRIGTKDYIVIKTENKLHIVSRRGKTRVTPKTSLTFSNQPVFEYKNGFTTTTKDGKLVLISTNGSVQILNTNLKPNHSIVSTTQTMVTQSDNLLNIKDKTLELDLANYTNANLFYINNKIYISITDTQNQKVLLYDSNAELLKNFPVYGTSAIDLDQIDKDNKLEFVTKGDKNNILVYKIN
ncbi:hypothetical protein C7H62_0400 [Mesoflavibacter sp. HG96]|uniref:DUF3352 domain-containing protein n=1 Tax=Mesoflavibacter TaxID=444051 RepID=UPI000D11154E|nr:MULTISPECIES: DUF3352 domain-containing protein [Mesoflavibacter]QIJ88209.1 hypothetical protein C7H62_0400 [Mesoflavibacter sp. HG96]QIJ90937.1 hypothetical protein C7H56_0400 [Mesoflavibacter sp. HG37]